MPKVKKQKKEKTYFTDTDPEEYMCSSLQAAVEYEDANIIYELKVVRKYKRGGFVEVK